MSAFEILSLLIPWMALVISIYTLFQHRRLQREANELQRATAKLAEKQLELLARTERERERAQLSLQLVGRQGEHLLLLRNVGAAEAVDVRIESVGEDSLLVKHQIDSMFPLHYLKPGEEVRLGAAIFISSPPKHLVRVSWHDRDGTAREEEFTLVQ